MPIALLLANIAGEFAKGVKSINSWDRLVALETTLVARARSAFLVHWFGPHLPLAGSALRVHIENLEALKARYHAATARGGGAGSNLMEPLAGMAGTLFGSLSAPINSMVFYAVADRYMQKWYVTLLAALNVLTFGVLGSLIGLVVGVASPLAIPALLSSDLVRVVYDFLGAFAEMIPAFVRFWHIVSGAGPVRNPLLAEMLEIGHHLATLLPFVFALFAFLAIHVTRILRPLALQLPLFGELIRSVMDVITLVMDNAIDHVKLLFSGEHSTFAAILRVIDALQAMMRSITRTMTAVFDKLEEAPRKWYADMSGGARSWLDTARPQIRAATTEHPVVEWFKALGRTLGEVSTIFAARAAHPSAPGASGPPGALTKAMVWLWGPPPPSPVLTLPDIPALEAAAGGKPVLPKATLGQSLDFEAGLLGTRRKLGLLPDAFALSRAATQRLRHARYPGSIFAAGQKRLERDLHIPLADAVTEAHEREVRFRDLLLEAVNRFLPDQAAERVRALGPLFDTLDKKLKQAPTGHTVAFPVLDVPESDRLRAAVKSLRIRVPGGNEAEARSWGLRLKSALLAQPYTARAGT